MFDYDKMLDDMQKQNDEVMARMRQSIGALLPSAPVSNDDVLEALKVLSTKVDNLTTISGHCVEQMHIIVAALRDNDREGLS